MTLFHVVDDAQIILRSKGVYRQAKVYQRDGDLYAGWGSGFLGLRRDHGTTLPSVSWENIDCPRVVAPTSNGRLAFEQD